MRRRLLLLSTLTALAFALTIGIEAALAGNPDPQLVTLTVSRGGTGNGRVTSPDTPAISCPGICSAQYPLGSSLWLSARPATGSYLATAYGDCIAPRDPARPKPFRGCNVTLTADTSVRFIFTLLSCDVPWARGKTLAAAKKTMASHDCTVGKIKHAASRTIKKGRVISLKPKAGAHLKPRARVDLLVSTGPSNGRAG